MKVELLNPGKYNLTPTEDTQYVLVPGVVGKDAILENEVIINLEKQGISAELLIAYSLNGNSEVIVKTVSNHRVPNTTCLVDIKAALFDAAKSDYEGKIIIEKNAQQTASYLEDNVLLLGDNAKNNSQPILEIEADDVKASHGATTGRLDESQIYYLTSRGLSREQAEKIIIEGFFESLIGRIKDAKIREQVCLMLKA